MGLVSGIGLGTGLDINGLVQQLVSAEGAPVTNALNQRQSAAQTRLSALGTLQGALSAFQSAAAKLKDSTIFDSLTSTSSNPSVLSASASTGAVAGSYSIDVTQLATAHKLVAGVALASANTVVGTGTLTIKSGTSNFSVTVGAGTDTLDSIRQAINKAAGNSGVAASIINTDAGAKLVLTAKNTGAANAITVTGSDDDGNNTDAAGLSQLFYDPSNTMGNAAAVVNMTQQTAAQDAIVQVDGQTITRSTNTVSGAIAGVTLTLNSTTVAGSPVSLNVALDQTTISKTVGDFATAYNNLRTVMGTLGGYDSASKSGGDLMGDATLRAVDSQLRRDLGAPVSSATSNYNTLHMLGVEIDRYGKMSVNQTKLSQAVSNNLDGLKEVFSSTDGIAVRVNNRLNGYLGVDGVFAKQTSSLNQTLRTISDQRDALQARLSRLQTNWLKQFQAMDSAVATLNNTGSYLSKQLSSLSISAK